MITLQPCHHLIRMKLLQFHFSLVIRKSVFSLSMVIVINKTNLPWKWVTGYVRRNCVRQAFISIPKINLWNTRKALILICQCLTDWRSGRCWQMSKLESIERQELLAKFTTKSWPKQTFPEQLLLLLLQLERLVSANYSFLGRNLTFFCRIDNALNQLRRQTTPVWRSSFIPNNSETQDGNENTHTWEHKTTTNHAQNKNKKQLTHKNRCPPSSLQSIPISSFHHVTIHWKECPEEGGT